MSVIRKSSEKVVDITIGPNNGNNWSEEKAAGVIALAKLHHDKRSPERIRKNAMAAVRYRIEEYVQDENITIDEVCTIEDFVKDFLKVLGLKKGEFAKYMT